MVMMNVVVTRMDVGRKFVFLWVLSLEFEEIGGRKELGNGISHSTICTIQGWNGR